MNIGNELATVLYKKVTDEQDKFRAWLLTRPQKEVLEHACEYAIRESIVSMIEEDIPTPAQVRILLKLDNPLAEVFQHWRNHQVGYLEGIRDALERCEAYTHRSQTQRGER